MVISLCLGRRSLRKMPKGDWWRCDRGTTHAFMRNYDPCQPKQITEGSELHIPQQCHTGMCDHSVWDIEPRLAG